MDAIDIRGARTHNLKDISLTLPRNKLVVITGLSGSGKSSLAFDTLYAEAQRRYVESLSAYGRQFLSLMEKPDVDTIEGLSPAVSIDQKATSRNPRNGENLKPAGLGAAALEIAPDKDPRTLLADWMADYLDDLEAQPVRSQVAPGAIAAGLARSAPDLAITASTSKPLSAACASTVVHRPVPKSPVVIRSTHRRG